MIVDILQTIINYCPLKNQLMCMEINTHTYNNLYVYAIDHKHTNNMSKMDQKIIEQKKYSRLKILKSEDSCVTDVNHLCNTLETLICGYDSRIDQNGIKDLKWKQ